LFEEAIHRVGAVEGDYLIAGRTMRLAFAGEALVSRLTPALSHHAVSGVAEPDVVLRAWDSRSTGVKMPGPPWTKAALGRGGEVRGYNTDRFRIAFEAPTLSVFDRDSLTAIAWVADPQLLPDAETGSAFRYLMNWYLETVEQHLVHAALVGVEGRGLLLTGEAGAGKSSTALACVRAGWSYVGDDYCVLDLTERPIGHGVWRWAKADQGALQRLGGLAYEEVGSIPERGKSMVELSQRHAELVVDSLPIHAVLLPRVRGTAATTLRPATPVDVLQGLSSTMLQLPGTGAPTWRALARLAHTAPGFHLDLGYDVDRIPSVMAGALLHGEQS
jgi:hypothetical protein